MNFGELLTEFYANGFDYLSDGGAGETRAKRFINQSYQELCAYDDWPFLEATATGTAPLTVSDMRKPLYVVDTANFNRTLWEVDQATLTDGADLTATGGWPHYYYLTGGTTVNIYPTATDSLTVRYIKTPTDLSADTDTPVVPAPYHDIIVLGAVRRALLDDTDGASIALIKQEWQDRLATMLPAVMNPISNQFVGGHSGDW